MQRKLSIFTLTVVLALLILFYLTVTPVQAQDNSGFVMEVTPAFEGHFKFGEWLPIWVELENSGPDLDAEIHVRKTVGLGSAIYAVPVTVPTGARKRVPVYILPGSYATKLTVELIETSTIDDNKPLLSQEFLVKPLPNQTYLVGLITAERGTLSLITSAPPPTDAREITLVDVSLADLPAQHQALNSFDLLVLNNVDTSMLTPAQSSALTAWVMDGGHLVIGGGANAQQTVAGLAPSLLPMSLEELIEVEQVSFSTFIDATAINVPGPFVMTTGDAGDSEMLAMAGELPLLVQKRIGKGRVEYIALDLAIAPFSGWTGTPLFWRKLLGSEIGVYPEWIRSDTSPRTMLAERLIYPLSNLPSLDLPSIRILGWLLLVYILLVGPANYFLLRRWQRLQWAWLTIPLLTIIFSAGAFGIGYAMRGTDLILSHIAIIEPSPEDGSAAVSSYMGLFSPAQESYEVTVESNGLISSMSSERNPWGPTGPIASEMLFLQSSPVQLRGLSVNQWSMESFMLEDRWNDFGSIEGAFQLGEKGLIGELVNETEHNLYDVTLVLGRYFKRLGDLPAGERMEATIDFDDKFVPLWRTSLAWDIYRSGETDSIELTDSPSREDELKRQIVEILFDPSLSQTRDTGIVWEDVHLIAWMKEAPPTVRISGSEPTRQTTAIVYDTFDFSVPDKGAFTLPLGLFPSKLLELSANVSTCGYKNAIYIDRGKAVFEFQLPPTIPPERVQTFRLSISQDGGSTLNAPEIAFLDWRTDSWSKLQKPIMGINVLSDADLQGLISEAGRIQVQLSAHQNIFGCIGIDLGMMVE